MRFTPESVADIEKENNRWPEELVNVTEYDWEGKDKNIARGLIEAWRSKGFYLFVYKNEDGSERLEVHRTTPDLKRQRWKDGITWDELQGLKRQCGRGAKMAIEVYPSDNDIIDVGNLRHLWIVGDGLPFIWAKQKKPEKNTKNSQVYFCSSSA